MALQAQAYKPDPLVMAGSAYARGKGIANHKFSCIRVRDHAHVIDCQFDMNVLIAVVVAGDAGAQVAPVDDDRCSQCSPPVSPPATAAGPTPGRYTLVLRDQPHPLAGEMAQFWADLDARYGTQTVTTVEAVRPEPAPVLYPTGPGQRLTCERCFRPSPITWASVYGRTCAPCHKALAAGLEVSLPSRKELPELLLTWARWDINGEVELGATDRMLAVLLPGLDTATADGRLGGLEDALLWQQEVSTPGYDWRLAVPGARDPEVVEQLAAARVDEALQELIGGGLVTAQTNPEEKA